MKTADRPNSLGAENYPADSAEIARLAKAIAHPARIAILKFLASQKSCFCGRIVNQIPLAQSTVSQHLRALRDAGLIEGTVDGVKVCYCLNANAITNARSLFNSLLNEIDNADRFHVIEYLPPNPNNPTTD